MVSPSILVQSLILTLFYSQQLVVGTPGRLFDMIRRRSLRVDTIKMLILDEADELLNEGFKEQVHDIYRYLPPGTQVVLVSATLPNEVLEMTRLFMDQPVHILVKVGLPAGADHSVLLSPFSLSIIHDPLPLVLLPFPSSATS